MSNNSEKNPQVTSRTANMIAIPEDAKKYILQMDQEAQRLGAVAQEAYNAFDLQRRTVQEFVKTVAKIAGVPTQENYRLDLESMNFIEVLPEQVLSDENMAKPAPETTAAPESEK